MVDKSDRQLESLAIAEQADDREFIESLQRAIDEIDEVESADDRDPELGGLREWKSGSSI